MKTIKWNSILLSLVYFGAGVILAFYPQLVRNRICEVIGGLLILFGLVRILLYHFMDVRQALFRNDLVEGIVLLLGGIMIVYQKTAFEPLVPFILGIYLMVSGFSKIQDSVDAKRLGYPNHSVFTVLALISIAASLVVLFNLIKNEDTLYLVVGIALIYSGITDFGSAIFISRVFQKYLEAEKHKDEPQPEPEPAPVYEEFKEPASAENESGKIVPEHVIVPEETPVLTLDEPVAEEPAETPSETAVEEPAEPTAKETVPAENSSEEAPAYVQPPEGAFGTEPAEKPAEEEKKGFFDRFFG